MYAPVIFPIYFYQTIESVTIKNLTFLRVFHCTIAIMLTNLQILYTYLLTLPVFFAIDLLWLGVIGKGIYDKYLGSFLADSPNWAAAGIFYSAYVFGIIYFAVLPAMESGKLTDAVIKGALFGGLAYATYEMTNWAVLKDWPAAIVFIDIAWGVVLTASVAAAGFYIAQWIG